MRYRLSRRHFLRTIGTTLAATGLAIDYPLQSAAQAKVATDVGFLLPESRLYPQFATELIDGFLQHTSVKPGVARLNTADLDSIRSFAMRHDTVVTYSSPSAAYSLRKRLIDVPARIIAVDLGTDLVRKREQIDQLHYLSLNYWQLAQALALWVRQALGERVLIVTDSYHSGYDTFSLFLSALPQSRLLFYEQGRLAQAVHEMPCDAIAFALANDQAQALIAESKRSGLDAPLVRLPSVEKNLLQAGQVYHASFAGFNQPFFTLGQRIARYLSGYSDNDDAILIERGSALIARYSAARLPDHGYRDSVKTGWTNPYPI